MLDLLQLVQEGQPSTSNASDVVEANIPQEHVVALSKNEDAQRQLALAAFNSKASSKGSGSLLSKYKNMRGRRRSHGSDTGEERQENGNVGLLEYSPLSKGENGDGRVDIEASSFPYAHQDAEAEQQGTTFMDKMRAYRSKQKARPGSKGSSEFIEGGPLQRGMSGKHLQQNGRRSSDPENDPAMRQFFAKVSEAKALLAKITDRQRHISSARVKSRTLVSSSEVQAAQEQVQEDMDEVTRICKMVKAKLLELDNLNGELLSEQQSEEDLAEHPELRMRLSVMAGLNAKLSEVTMGWQQIRSQWQAEDHEEVAHQLHTVTGRQYAPEEVDELVHSGGTEQIYRQAMSNAHGASIQQLMSDVQQRHDQIRQLEASMLELHQVFLDMSILVADQGDTINSIDNWVTSTAMTMQQSLRQLRAAKESRRKAATTKAVTFVTGVGLVAGGAGLTATGFGAVAGIPMIVAGAAAVGGSAIGGIT